MEKVNAVQILKTDQGVSTKQGQLLTTYLHGEKMILDLSGLKIATTAFLNGIVCNLSDYQRNQMSFLTNEKQSFQAKLQLVMQNHGKLLSDEATDRAIFNED